MTTPGGEPRRIGLGLATAIFVAALAIGAPFLGSIDHYSFDEAYHAFTAAEIARANPDAWRWDTTPARERVAYEWTHPPLGKLLVAAGIAACGDRPLGWRIVPALAGAAGIVLVAALASAMSGSVATGLLAALCLRADGLWLVLSRTAMLDVFLATFVLAALLALHRLLTRETRGIGALVACGLFTGLALATKWSAAPVVVAVAVLVIGDAALRDTARAARLRRLAVAVAAVVVLPMLLYVAAYAPFFLDGNGLGDFVELQGRMLGYHANLESTHAYQSPWWSWPFSLRPVWFAVARGGEEVGNVYAGGNPFLFWAFVPAVLMTLWRRRHEHGSALVLAVGFFGQWLPWAASPRIAYLYHFLPAVPFGCLAIADTLTALGHRGARGQQAVVIYLALVVCAFAFFYPVWTGLPLSNELFARRLWLGRWR